MSTQIDVNSKHMEMLNENMEMKQGKKFLVVALLVLGTFASQAQVKISGNVFGGGRMADVKGNSNITVLGQEGSSTQIEGVYGGNDIAGSVEGSNGSTIVIGNNTCNRVVEINSVYGGGNGYYQYGDMSAIDGANVQALANGTQVKTFNGVDDVVALSAANNVPSILKSNITVSGSQTKIDSVFGGAKNAYLTQLGNVAASIDIQNGVVNQVFGGNNYGGFIKGNIAIALNGVVDPSATDNAQYATIGDAWGVRTIFGGGNKVEASGNVTIDLLGGYVDTVFAGGNSATVGGTTVNVNFSNNTYTAGTEYDGATGFYNVRTLFGGNNQAEMSILPTLNLTRGGMGDVYGGGNAGNMLAGNTSAVTDYTLSTFVEVNSSDAYIDVLYGGCRQASVLNGGTYVKVQDGHIGDVYGGCNISGVVSDATGTNVIINGGTIEENVFGGSNGYYGCRDAATNKYTNDLYHLFASSLAEQQTVLFPQTNTTHVTISNGVVNGSVYGGGKLAPVGEDRDFTGGAFADNTGATYVSITGGTINKNAFAGGMMADVYGVGNLAVSAGTIHGDVYGGNDIAGTLTGSMTYTASNASNYDVTSHVTITGAPTIEGDVFGSGNGDYTYYTSKAAYDAATEPNKVLVCDATIPSVANTFVDVNVGDAARLNSVYAGGNNATATTTATVLLNQAAVDGALANVDNIFGGNNTASMDILPDIILTKGNVNTVYGGGNKGEMLAANTTKVTDHTLGTYVEMNNADVKVSKAIYGGGKVAGVEQESYVKLTAGTAPAVFGGNDISGNVSFATIVLEGTAEIGDIYGGGNGQYYYDGDNAYAYNDHSQLVATAPGIQVPNANATYLYLNSGIVNNVYGGGLAGDVHNATTNVTSGASITGVLFGGGCGDVASIGLCNTHVGNVTGKATLNIDGLYAELPRVFAGGRAGDVVNAEVNVSGDVDKKIKALYGGCMASNLTGTTTLNIGEDGKGTVSPIIDTVYGGNDFAGLTNNTNITINSGSYIHVFGGGNGDYDYKTLLSAGTGCYDTLPYSMHIDVTYNDGYFADRVFGGGNMALVGDKAISSTNYPQGTDNRDLMGTINVSVHGGRFNQHIFLGAKGNLTLHKNAFGFQDNISNYADWNFSDNSHLTARPSVLAYAYKQFNMDGGHVEFSVYGGSESVDDGMPYECYGASSDSTSMAPSTILNIVGGTVENRVYGGGYKGNCYGSIYVNVGREAVYDCPAWTTPIGQRVSGSVQNPYMLPDSYFELAYNLRRTPLYLNSSIYNGSDWGEAGSNQYFNTRGFYGGVGRICVDGLGYQTSISHASSNPDMNIAKSIIGAGTSTNPADINSRILVRNYGDFYCPTPSKQLYSIQRTDNLYLENSFFTLTGEQDAYQSFTSASQALCRIDTVIFHGSNVVEQKTSSIYLGMIRSEDFDGNLEKNYENSTADMWTGTLDGCTIADDAYICNLLSTDVVSRNVMMLDNGSYVDVFPFVDDNNNGVEDDAEPELHVGHDLHPYGPVDGYLYLMASHGTRAYVYARDKITVGTQENVSDGGFLSPCRGTNVESANSPDHVADHELDYTNVAENSTTRWPAFRSWSVGQEEGTRSRNLAIVAHADPHKVIGDEYCTTNISGTDTTFFVMGGEGGKKFAYATATLELPPSNAGNYYTINAVSIDNNNGNQVKLTDWAWDPKKAAGDDGCSQWYTSFISTADNPLVSCTTPQEQMQNNPDYTFGLIMSMGNNFNNAPTTVTGPGGSGSFNTQSQTIISANQALTNLGGFTSSQIVTGANGAIPTIDFTLTYRTDIATTITREVTFTMNEYTAAGVFVGPVDVTLTISTIITDFRDLEARTLAMYNHGRTNQYVRQVIIPASFMQREMYLTDVEWYADKLDENADGDFNDENEYNRTPHFNLHPSTESPNTFEYNDFSITVSPSEDITQNISNSLGWYRIEAGSEVVDPYALGKSINASVNASNSNNINLPTAQKIGVLDGRAAASLNVVLNFNGSKLYENFNPVGWVKLKFKYINTGDKEEGNFDLLVRVRTRESGDTIYMAEPRQMYMLANGSVFRTVDEDLTNAPSNVVTTIYRYDDNDLGSHDQKYKKNDPVLYLSSFSRAGDVYDEGDVICILDTIHIDTKNASSLRGSNFGNIYVTRYTGNHFRFPGDSAAYRGPMIMLESGAKFTAANVIFYGGGVGRVATSSALTQTPNSHSTFDYEHRENNINDESGWTSFASKEYRYHHTKADTLFADAPVFWLEGNSWLNLATNVEIIDNYNRSQFTGSYVDGSGRRSSFPGGAIGMRKTTAGTPKVILGNMVNVHYNLVTDHADANGPLAYGGAVFNDGADLTLSVEHASVKNLIHCDSNYYVPLFKDGGASNQWGIQSGYLTTAQSSAINAAGNNGLAQYFDRSSVTLEKPTSHTSITIDYVELKKGASTPTDFHHSNVYLTRTPADASSLVQQSGETAEEFALRQAEYPVQFDNHSTLINVVGELDAASRVGVSKWFPGFVHRDLYPRDTIAFASYAQAGSFAATNNAASGVFVDDSSTTATDYRIYDDRDHSAACTATTPEDEVDIRFSTLLNPTKIYLHRCASFREQAVPILFAHNSAVVCPGDGDTIRYMVKGGASSYVYKWETRTSSDPETWEELYNQAGTTFESGNGWFIPHAHSFAITEDSKEIHYRATAQESGGCELSHEFRVLLKQVGAEMSTGSYNTTSLSGGQYVDNSGDHYYISKYIDSLLAPVNGKYYINNGADPITRTADPIHYSVPGSAYSSMETVDKAHPNVGVIVRFYSYYRLNAEVSPATTGNITIHTGDEDIALADLPNTKLCPGDVLSLNVTPTDASRYEFMMWDYDPTAGSELSYVVHDPDPNAKVVAYMSPNQYWYQQVDTFPDESHYEVDYHGNVHIKDETGLAWFISTVNGLNGQQAQSFIFDTIYIYPKTDGYDMKDYKWTPVGNTRLPFRGVIQDVVPTGEGSTTIKNIIVNEPELQYVGLFGVTDSARITNLYLDSPVIKGTAYGAALVGYASDDSKISSNTVDNATISANNAAAGLAARASNAVLDGNTIDNSQIVGPTLYAAGICAEAENTQAPDAANPGDVPGTTTQIANNYANINTSKLNALYVGGFVGRSEGADGSGQPQPAAKSANNGHLYIANNYVRMTSGSEALYAGGMVGYAMLTDMENNYAYGSISSMSAEGGLVGRAGSGVNIDRCYYDNKLNLSPVGYAANVATSNVSTFTGEGNQVVLADSVDGINNMTRVLNTWVRQNGTDKYKTWRSDLDGVNSGYPIFGTPDQIPVYDTISNVVCDSADINGMLITESGSYTMVISDTVNYVDSTITMILTVNHSDVTTISDTVAWGDDYYGLDRVITAEQIQALMATDTMSGIHTLQIVDSLLSENGCDSLIVLNLTIYKTEGIDEGAKFTINIYPNPTLGKVNVDADELESVEVYDAISRKVKELRGVNGHCEFDLTNMASGSYYLRVVTAHGVAVRKVVKK